MRLSSKTAIRLTNNQQMISSSRALLLTASLTLLDIFEKTWLRKVNKCPDFFGTRMPRCQKVLRENGHNLWEQDGGSSVIYRHDPSISASLKKVLE